MTVSATPTGVVYVVTNPASGVEYVLNFPYITPEHVRAYYRYQGTDTALEYGRDYVVNGQVLSSVSLWPAGAVLAIYRETDSTQDIHWVDGQRVYTPDIEQADDKLTMLIQEVLNDVNRAVKVPRDDPEQTPEDLIADLYTARDDAQASATEAANDAARSAAASDLAEQHAHDAATSRDAAAGSAEESRQWAEKSEELGAAQAELARKWAENPEDAPVIAEHYSAYHWARKALQAATEGGEYSDALNGSRMADQMVAASEWALGQVNARAEAAGVVAVKAQGTAEEALKSGPPLLSLLPCPTGIIEPGYLFLHVDNGILTADAFPQAYAKLVQGKAAGSTAILTGDAAWQAEKLANGGVCPRFMLDTAAETFRIPFTPGLFFRDAGAGLKAGDYQIDTMRPITGETQSATHGGFADTTMQMVGAFKTIKNTRGGAAYNSTEAKDHFGLDTALLGPHYSGDKTQPEHAVYPIMMKMYGAVVESGTADIAALIQATTGKLDASVFHQIPFRNVWISGEYELSTAFALIVATHGLTLPETLSVVKAEALLRCKSAEFGYSPGDLTAPGFYVYFGSTAYGDLYSPPVLTATTVSIPNRGDIHTAPHVVNRLTGGFAALTSANWRMIFRIYY